MLLKLAPMIILKDLSMRYGSLTALHSTDLEIETGRTTALIGPSGCGKSTILRLLMGLIEPSTGVIEIDGRALALGNLLEMRRRMGYVIQDGGLFPHLTAAQNVELMARHIKK